MTIAVVALVVGLAAIALFTLSVALIVDEGVGE